jgi:enamine deaminase RidA (YjgF/YER057c/UK114 family)
MHSLTRASFRAFSSAAIRRIDVNLKYSGAVAHNGTVYLTGQVPGDDCLTDARVQTKSVLKKIDALLAEAGSSKAALLSATCLLTHLDDDFAALNDEWVKWLPKDCAPTRTTIGGVALANKQWRVEIQVTAALTKAKREGKPLSPERLAKLREGREKWAAANAASKAS